MARVQKIEEVEIYILSKPSINYEVINSKKWLQNEIGIDSKISK
ncbi:hypothetical protein SAMN06298216_4088 [Spirosomataceae bacterium TFI 002]|nr:hypothetical protein SAMN06298216_4088 [Spirosomataceae bacterium TFI 002]